MRALVVAAALVWLGGCDRCAPAAPSAPGATTHVDATGPAGATLPARADDARLPAHADDVADYTLRATLDAGAHTIHGEGHIHWRNASSQPVHELWVHLYLNAFKNERSAFLRERVGGRGSSVPDDWGWIDVRRLTWKQADGGATELWPGVELSRPGDEDETDARVPLPRPVAPRESMDLDVVFDDKLPSVVERTGYHGSFHMVGQWFPKLARHAARVARRGDRPRCGSRPALRCVHDFAWTAWDRWRTLGGRVDGVGVEVLYPPGFEEVARRDLSAVAFALPYESERYGPYPYAQLTVAHVPDAVTEAGGMEYPTFITTEGAWYTPAGLRVPEIVTVHELGHQWFYGLVATNESRWPFLDEGVNQFAETDTMRAWRGDGSALCMLGLRVSDTSVQLVGSEGAVQDEPVAKPAGDFTSGANYGRLVYARTAAILETFARVYGREVVYAAIGDYARRERFRHPGPDEFIASFAAAIGDAPAETLRHALFERGWVDYLVDGVTSERAQSSAGVFDRGRDRRDTLTRQEESGWIGSVLVRRRGPLAFPVDVDLQLADGTTRRQRWDGAGESIRLPYEGPAALVAATVDPDDRVAIDANFENNRTAAPGESRGAWHVLERAEYLMQLAIDAMAP